MFYTKFTKQIILYIFIVFLVVKKENPPQRYTELHREKYSVVLCVLCGEKDYNHEVHYALHKVHKADYTLYFHRVPCGKNKTHHRGTRSYTEKNTPWFSVFSVVKKITTTKCTMFYMKCTKRIYTLYFTAMIL